MSVGSVLVIGNLLDDAIVTMTPEADPDLPVAGLRDGPGKMVALFSDLTANPEVRIDFGAPIDFGNGDGPGNFSGAVLASDGVVITLDTPSWTVDADTGVAQLQTFDDGTAALVDHGGNGFSLGLGASVGPSVAAYAITVKAGRRYRIRGWVANGTSAATLGSLRLFDRTTGRYLTSAGAWTSTPTAFVTDTTFNLAWVGGDVTFTAPTAAELGADTAVFEFQIRGADSGFVFADDLELYAVLDADFLMVAAGHNVNAGLTPTWETSDDASSWTARATLTPAKDQFFKRLDAPVSARYHRLRLVGTPIVQIFLGEVVLGLAEELPRSPQDRINVNYDFPGQARQKTPAGTEWVANRTGTWVRRFEGTYRFASLTEARAALALIEQLKGGNAPGVIVPAADLPELVLFGRIEAPLNVAFSMLGQQQPDDATLYESMADFTLSLTEGPAFEL